MSASAPVSVEVLSDENDQLPPAMVAGALAMATRRVLQAAGVPTARASVIDLPGPV